MTPERAAQNPHTYAKNGIIQAIQTECPGGVGSTPGRGRNLLGGSAMITVPICACGCGELVNIGRKYVSGHNLKDLYRTEEHRRKIGEAQRRAWSTKRKRMPLGSTRLNAGGYVRVKVGEANVEWALEHVLVMESILGRSISPGEIVHHINGIKTDNRPENLHLCRSMSTHNHAHKSFEQLLSGLVADGIVRFNSETEEYERC